jgi:hypothetical protein
VDDTFPSSGRPEVVILRRRDGGNILTPGGLSRAFTLHNLITQLTWSNRADDRNDAKKVVEHLPAPVNFTDICLNVEGTTGADEPTKCVINNVLQLFNYTGTRWASNESIQRILNDRSTWSASLVYRGFVLDTVLGGIMRAPNGTTVTGAKALSMVYLLAGNQTLIDQQKPDKAAEGWEDAFLEMLEVRADNLS